MFRGLRCLSNFSKKNAVTSLQTMNRNKNRVKLIRQVKRNCIFPHFYENSKDFWDPFQPDIQFVLPVLKQSKIVKMTINKLWTLIYVKSVRNFWCNDSCCLMEINLQILRVELTVNYFSQKVTFFTVSSSKHQSFLVFFFFFLRL